MEHSFVIEIAQEYGVNAAIILNNISFCIEKNKANNDNFYDGRYWTHNTVAAFQKLFPYMTNKQIMTALKKLEDADIIITGNYNKSAYDRTKWYALTDKGNSIIPKCQMDLPNKSNQFDKNGDCTIPDINTDICNAQSNEKLFMQFWEAYPKKRSKDDAFKAFKSRKPNPILVGEMIASIQLMKDSGEWSSQQMKYIPYPGTWLRAGGWKDEVEPHKKEPQGKVWKSLD